MTAPGSTADRFAFGSDEKGAAQSAFSIGAHLAAQRRLRGVTLAELEAVTRIPQRSLARLESGAFDRQQDAFVRGFVRTVAIAIGLDPADVLVRLVEAGSAHAEGCRRTSRRRVRSGLPLLVLLVLAVGTAAVTVGAPGLSAARGILARPEAVSVVRPDYVREFAEAVRTAAPGTFGRGRPVAAPPEMFVAPAPPEAPLDAVLTLANVYPASPAPVSFRLE